jgi:hypothetical protein
VCFVVVDSQKESTPDTVNIERDSRRAWEMWHDWALCQLWLPAVRKWQDHVLRSETSALLGSVTVVGVCPAVALAGSDAWFRNSNSTRSREGSQFPIHNLARHVEPERTILHPILV